MDPLISCHPLFPSVCRSSFWQLDVFHYLLGWVVFRCGRWVSGRQSCIHRSCAPTQPQHYTKQASKQAKKANKEQTNKLIKKEARTQGRRKRTNETRKHGRMEAIEKKKKPSPATRWKNSMASVDACEWACWSSADAHFLAPALQQFASSPSLLLPYPRQSPPVFLSLTPFWSVDSSSGSQTDRPISSQLDSLDGRAETELPNTPVLVIVPNHAERDTGGRYT